MANQRQRTRQKPRESRHVFLSFEFQRDTNRRGTFIGQAKNHCEFDLVDKSLPAAQHSNEWRQEAKARMKTCDAVIVLLGPDTQNAPGVKDELSLAGEVGCPVIQLMPQGQNYGLAARHGAVCRYKWAQVNQMLSNPRAFAQCSENRGK